MNTAFVVVIAVLLFVVILVVHEGGHYVVARLCGIQVNEFSIGMGPTLLQREHKGILYTLRLLPIGAYVAMEGEDSPESTSASRPVTEPPRGVPFNEAKIWKRMLVVVAGAVMNFVLGFVFLVILISGDDCIVSLQIHSFSEGALSQQTGLQVEDTILAINGRRCFVANDMIYELSRTENYTADFTVLRNGQTVEIPSVQFDVQIAEDGSEYMSLGFKVRGLELTPWRVVKEAGGTTLYCGRIIFSSLCDLVRGRESINDLSGPVGIASAIGEAATHGLDMVIRLMALLTINLGVFNLLPIPALDGGKLFLLLIEALIRRPIPERLQVGVNLLGFALLFGLMLFATYNDIVRLF